jgi:hypothetical protein
MDDVLGRLQNLKDGATTLAGYTYLGSGTVIRREHLQPQIRLDLWGGTSGIPIATGTGLDGFGRVVDQGWVNYNSGKDLDRFGYAYDRNSSPLYEQNALSASNSELYHANGASGGYDSLDRLPSFGGERSRMPTATTSPTRSRRPAGRRRGRSTPRATGRMTNGPRHRFQHKCGDCSLLPTRFGLPQLAEGRALVAGQGLRFASSSIGILVKEMPFKMQSSAILPRPHIESRRPATNTMTWRCLCSFA